MIVSVNPAITTPDKPVQQVPANNTSLILLTIGLTLAVVVLILGVVGSLYFCKRKDLEDTPSTKDTPEATPIPQTTPFDPAQVVNRQHAECDVESNLSIISSQSKRLRRSTVMPMNATPDLLTRYDCPTKTGGALDEVVLGTLMKQSSNLIRPETECNENA